jgi:CRISPR-associated protein Csb2
MLTLGIEYLTGYAVATDAANRDRPEWPPHPARVFMALAAAYFETGADPTESAVLHWLEGFDNAPAIVASAADVREPVVHYVPVNDELHASGAALPILRRRQPRGFPRVRPHDPTVYYVWDGASAAPDQLVALNALCGKVTRLGHSSSLVRMWATDTRLVPRPLHTRLVPDEQEFDQQMRIITNGSLDELRRRFRADDLSAFQRLKSVAEGGQGKIKAEAKEELRARFNDAPPRVIRPEFRITVGYRLALANQPVIARSVWDQRLLIFGLEPCATTHARLDIRAGAAVAHALRDAAMVAADKAGLPISEALSGHQASGAPSDTPHCAILPLAYVGGPYADGHLVGVAVAFPHTLEAAVRRQIATVFGKVQELWPTRALGKWRLLRSGEMADLYNLRSAAWCGPSGGANVWATVTPIAFDEHTKAKDRAASLEETAGMIARACVRIGLPAPESVQVSSVSAHVGTPTAYEFARLARKDGSLRRQAHARLRFAEPVLGPVLLGAGRYRGYGLCRPLFEDQQ